jgi:putative transposase
VSEAQEAKQLRDENTRLRKLVADLSLDKEALQSVIQRRTTIELLPPLEFID